MARATAGLARHKCIVIELLLGFFHVISCACEIEAGCRYQPAANRVCKLRLQVTFGWLLQCHHRLQQSLVLAKSFTYIASLRAGEQQDLINADEAGYE